jgi:hypothetical protein
MTIRRLEKSEWRPFLMSSPNCSRPRNAEVEVASLNLGDQTQAEWLPLLGISYDPRDDVVDIALDGLDHMIRKSREGAAVLTSLEIVDADGVGQIVKLRDQLMLPPPRT